MVYSKPRNLKGLGIQFGGCCQLSNCVISLWLMMFCSFNSKRRNPAKKNKQMWPGKFKPFRQGEYTTKFWLFAVLILFWVILYGFHLVSIRLCHAKGGTPDFGKICLTDIPAIIGRPSRSSTLLKGDRPSSSSPNFASRQFFPMTHYQIAVRLV